MVVVAMLLGFMGYILILNLIQVLRIPLDYLTMAFALWNFSVTGLISVFWKGPMWVQQMYLTVMSSLMVRCVTHGIYYLTLPYLYAKNVSLNCSHFLILIGILFDWTGRVDYMDAVGTFGCLGYIHAFVFGFSTSLRTKRSKADVSLILFARY
jgi:hypothetical protein